MFTLKKITQNKYAVYIVRTSVETKNTRLCFVPLLCKQHKERKREDPFIFRRETSAFQLYFTPDINSGSHSTLLPRNEPNKEAPGGEKESRSPVRGCEIYRK